MGTTERALVVHGNVDGFAIVATFYVAEGRVDEFLPLLLAHRDRCLKDEPGTLRFAG